ncbi:hypothetical protein D9599_15470 [Roseomonas sp. KE2513]|nr:hypothetical protein [Roseomonas sp. KE2513]
MRARITDLLDACDVYDASFRPGTQPLQREAEPAVISLREGETCQAVRDPNQGRVAITIVFGLLWALTLGVGVAGTFYLVRGVHGLFSASGRYLRARRA